jgi:pyruvate,water dikinase
LTRWVVNLHDTAAGDAQLAGGKAAQLHRLVHAGMPVPDAFIVTTEAFRAHFPAAAPGQRPPAPPLQPQLAQAINLALAAQFAPDQQLAVRSSALGEDGVRWSFAGQHETYYYIAPADVAEAVTDCWLSLWSAHAESYRARRDDPDGRFAMAVMVQRMVQAERSGVCFTTDPTGRHPEQVLIEATWGLGAALVDGRVSPDRLIMDRCGKVLRRHTGRKRHQVAATLRRPRDTRLEPVPTHQQTQAVLSELQAGEVLVCSLEAERLCGSPQDVEWAYEGETLYLLQSRPITTLTPELPAGAISRSQTPPVGAISRSRTPSAGAISRSQTSSVGAISRSRTGEANEDSRSGDRSYVLFKPLAENFTEPLSPMTVDLFRRVLPPIGRFINGRYYLNLDTARRACPFRWTTRELVDVLLLRGEVPVLRWDWRKVPLAAAGLAVAYLADGIAWHRSAHLTRESLGEYAVLCNRLRQTDSPDAREGLGRLVLGRHPFEPIGRMAYYINVSSGRYFLLLGMLTKLVERYAQGFDRHLLSQLCSGDGGTFSRQLVEGVRRLADVAREDAELCRRVTAADTRELTVTLATLSRGHPFVLALEAFLVEFGHRCMREMELAVPRWREDPLPILLMVRGYLRSPPTPPRDTHALHLLARDSLRRALPRRWQQALADYLIRRVSYYTSLREDTRHYHAMAMDVTRSKLLDLEQALITEGRLRLAGDVFYLTWDETQALRTRRLDWSDVANRIRLRRRRERDLARAGPAETLGTELQALGRAAACVDAQTTAAADPAIADGKQRYVVLTGQCASPGSAEGRVRIVLDPATANDLEAGDILVAPYTDPAWTPLFPLAAAVVVEVGSFLSHAGTVAREYGIPCLVDVIDCTSRLQEGQHIRVFASEGRLEAIPS